jgi:hypothetical protein
VIHSKRWTVGLVACVVSVGVFARAPVAVAKEEFPREIAQHLGAKTNPPCGLCHEYGKTGNATLTTPFAWSMRARGMSNGGSILGALDRVAADKVDSDGDGALDVDELVAGSDPNSPDSTPGHPGTVGDPQLGCAVAGDARGAWTSIVAALLMLGIGARRARGRFEGRALRRSPSPA